MRILSPNVLKKIVQLPGFEDFSRGVGELREAIARAELFDQKNGPKAVISEALNALGIEAAGLKVAPIKGVERIAATTSMSLSSVSNLLDILSSAAQDKLQVYSSGKFMPYSKFFNKVEKNKEYKERALKIFTVDGKDKQWVGNLQELSPGRMLHFLGFNKEVLKTNGKDTSFLEYFEQLYKSDLKEAPPSFLSHKDEYTISKIKGFRENLEYLKKYLHESEFDFSDDKRNWSPKLDLKLAMEGILNNVEQSQTGQKHIVDKDEMIYTINYIKANALNEPKPFMAFLERLGKELAKGKGPQFGC